MALLVNCYHYKLYLDLFAQFVFWAISGSYVLPPKPGICVLAFPFEMPFDFEITGIFR